MMRTLIAPILGLASFPGASAQPHPCGWTDFQFPDVTEGRNSISDVLNYGIIPLQADYPSVEIDESSEIDFGPAQASRAFTDSYVFDDLNCFRFHATDIESSVAVNLMNGDSDTIARDLAFASSGYGGAIYNFGESASDYAWTDLLQLSSDWWSDSYLNVIRPALVQLGTSGGCIDPTYYTQSQLLGEAFLIPTESTTVQCRTFNNRFVEDYNNLPTVLSGNEQAYLDFCTEYGFQFPIAFRLGYQTNFVQVSHNDNTTTRYHLGHTGKLYEGEQDCRDPVISAFRAEGWHRLPSHSSDANMFDLAIAANFQEIYKSYPVSDMLNLFANTSSVNEQIQDMLEARLSTYEPPPPSACSSSTADAPAASPVAAPTMNGNMPTTSTTAGSGSTTTTGGPNVGATDSTTTSGGATTTAGSTATSGAATLFGSTGLAAVFLASLLLGLS